MIKRTRFKKLSRRSRKQLLKRLKYLVDAEHENHFDKTIHDPATYRCDGQGSEAVFTKFLELFARYQESRKGKKGNRTWKLFEEFIFSSPEASQLTKEERALIEKKLVQDFLKNVPVFAVWHDDELLGRADLHLLVSGYTDEEVPHVFTSYGYGHGGKHILLEAERVIARALKEINARRPVERWVLTAREIKKRAMKKAGRKSLGQMLAKIWNGKRETLRAALRKLRYRVIALKDKVVEVVSPAGKAHKFVIATLAKTRLAEIAKESEGDYC